jgi:tRNA pseudouridine55 synthase
LIEAMMNGILIVDKEKNWTSHDVCAFVRSRFQIRRVGHAGTLDPLATGVLVLMLGNMTKYSSELSSCAKEYSGSFRLGLKTHSHDITGEVLGEHDVSQVTPSVVEEKFHEFCGEQEQVPPMVSALKHRGVRLYRLARAGKIVDRPPRKIRVHEFYPTGIELPTVHFFASVSKGTYVRTLVNDLGEKLGCFATLTELRRVRAGTFGIEQAVAIDVLRRCDQTTLSSLIIKSAVPFAD